MVKLLFGFIDNRKIIWFHYLLLTGLLFLGFYFGEKYLKLSTWNYFFMFIFWFVILFLGDNIVHKIIGAS